MDSFTINIGYFGRDRPVRPLLWNGYSQNNGDCKELRGNNDVIIGQNFYDVTTVMSLSGIGFRME